jgi:hypothetical protein
MSNYHWFSDQEVAQWQLDGQVWAMLDMARQKTVDDDPNKKGVPFIITRGKDTLQHEMALHGGVSDSSHILGLGVDLSVTDDASLCAILVGLFYAGFRRIGIYGTLANGKMVPTHIHADFDAQLPTPATWVMQEQN